MDKPPVKPEQPLVTGPSREALPTPAEKPAAREAQTEPAEQTAAREALTGNLLHGRYLLEGVLGEGALGRTYLAEDQEASRKVAIKELLPGRFKSWEDYELFDREATILRTLSHPSVPAYYDHFEEEGPLGRSRLYLVQEFIDGENLADELARRGDLPEEEVREIAAQVLEILTYLHNLTPPVIHRDLKPGNLMRRKSGAIVLIDFGTVREIFDVAAMNNGSTVVGTFGYMPPEQYAGMAYPSTDLYALGATCVQLLTAKAPEAFFSQLFHIEIPRETAVSIGFREWLDRMLEPDLSRRYASAPAAARDLEEAFLMGADIKDMETKLPPYPGKPPRRYPGFHYREPLKGSSRLLTACLLTLTALTTYALPVGAAIKGEVGWLSIGILIALVSTGAFLARGWKVFSALRFFKFAESTTGELILTMRPPWMRSDPWNPYLHYRYYVAGKYYRGAIKSRHKSLVERKAGDPIGILYDPKDPSRHEIYVG